MVNVTKNIYKFAYEFLEHDARSRSFIFNRSFKISKCVGSND